MRASRKRHAALRLLWLACAAALADRAGVQAQLLRYPAADRDEIVDDYHGTRVADPYRWLEQLDAPRTRQWLEAETRLTSDTLASLPDRAAIRRRLELLWNFERTGVPWREAGRIFYLRNTGIRLQPVLFAQKTLDSPPRVALDPDRISPDGSLAVRDYSVSPDARFLAYNVAQGGGDVAETRIRRLSDGRDLQEAVEGVLNNVCWTRDGRGFFYVRRAEPQRAGGARGAAQVAYHLLGKPRSRDRRIVEWKEARWVYCMTGEDGRYALFVNENGPESEVFAQDLGDPLRPRVDSPAFRLLAGRAGFHTPLEVVGGTLYLKTNDRAPKGRIAALDLRAGEAAEPRDVVQEAADVIEAAALAGNRIVVHYLVDVKSRLSLFDLRGKPMGEVALPGLGAVGWPLNGRPSRPELFYSFVSFLAPPTVYRLDLRSGRSVPFLPPGVPFDPGSYETRQVFFTSKDGTRVPMFVTAEKGLALDGAHPALLTAYGGYGASLQPDYSPDMPLWLESGGIYAVANIRGGGEYGEGWHRAGMLGNKQNGFDDFFAAAEFLISRGYTSSERLAIYGHSNGGLLVGAAVTQRPELFAVAIPNAGHYDMLRYDRFTAGAAWVSEYGSPGKPDDFRHLRAYSPLHNVRAGACYPATLLLAADHDDRVVPSHSYKFAAELQAAQGCGRPVLLRVAADASHSYESRQEQIAERTDLWSFVFWQMKMAYRDPARISPAADGLAVEGSAGLLRAARF